MQVDSGAGVASSARNSSCLAIQAVSSSLLRSPSTREFHIAANADFDTLSRAVSSQRRFAQASSSLRPRACQVTVSLASATAWKCSTTSVALVTDPRAADRSAREGRRIDRHVPDVLAVPPMGSPRRR